MPAPQRRRQQALGSQRRRSHPRRPWAPGWPPCRWCISLPPRCRASRRRRSPTCRSRRTPRSQPRAAAAPPPARAALTARRGGAAHGGRPYRRRVGAVALRASLRAASARRGAYRQSCPKRSVVRKRRPLVAPSTPRCTRVARARALQSRDARKLSARVQSANRAAAQRRRRAPPPRPLRRLPRQTRHQRWEARRCCLCRLRTGPASARSRFEPFCTTTAAGRASFRRFCLQTPHVQPPSRFRC